MIIHKVTVIGNVKQMRWTKHIPHFSEKNTFYDTYYLMVAAVDSGSQWDQVFASTLYSHDSDELPLIKGGGKLWTK